MVFFYLQKRRNSRLAPSTLPAEIQVYLMFASETLTNRTIVPLSGA